VQVVPMKKLLLWVELAKQDLQAGEKIPLPRWEQVLQDLSS
jgi:vesicle-fusing ATPase